MNINRGSKTVLLFLLGVVPLISFSQSNQDTIYWKQDCKLSWKDFKGPPDSSSDGDAGTMSGIQYRSLKYDEDTIKIYAFCFFLRLESWAMSNDTTIDGLKHEQNHFNISEI